jgi:excisionase family DNA binding protein
VDGVLTAPLLMTVPEAALYLGRSVWWVRERARDGRIPAKRDGSRLLIPRPQLDAWLGGDDHVAVVDAIGVPSPKRGRRVA